MAFVTCPEMWSARRNEKINCCPTEPQTPNLAWALSGEQGEQVDEVSIRTADAASDNQAAILLNAQLEHVAVEVEIWGLAAVTNCGRLRMP
jgi:hypothetical protein